MDARSGPTEQPIVTDTWREKYRYEQEPEYSATCYRVINALTQNETDEFRAEAYRAMAAKEIVPAGRILAGAGTAKRVTLINCFVSPDIQDSMRTEPGLPGQGIMDALATASYTQQMGGGIGMDFSTVRPRGALVNRTQSVSSGVLPFMDMWNAMCATIRSSGARRGAMMATLGIWHPDIEEFIEAKQTPGRLTNFNVSVLVPDAFMRAVENNEQWELWFSVPRADKSTTIMVSARGLWDKITAATYVHAEPGVLFIDRINELNNLSYCEYIHATNPCFTGDTQVWTAYGPKRFDELAATGETVPVLTQLEDGQLVYRDMERPRRTRRGVNLVEVTFRSISTTRKYQSITRVRCTPDHEFYLVGGEARRATDLQPDDRVASVYRRRANQKGYLCLRGEAETVAEHWVAAEYQHGRRPDYPREHVHHCNEVKADNRPENTEIIPAPRHNAMKMLGERNPMVRFPEKNPFSRPGFAAGSNNGRYRSDICDEEVVRLRNSGLPWKRVASQLNCSIYTAEKRYRETTGVNHSVVSVRPLAECEDVYCGTVPATGRFFICVGRDEGVMVSNCGEQVLPANGDCNLGHVNLAVMVNQPFEAAATFDFRRMMNAAEIMVRLLDNVLDVTLWPTEEQAEEARQKRRIGLGFTGLGSALQQLGIPYGSEKAIEFTHNLGKRLAVAAYKTSIQLAKERGPFPLFNADKFCERPFLQKLGYSKTGGRIIDDIRKHGIRNGVLLSVAPTGTTSLLMGNVSSGIEPVFAHSYRRKVREASGELSREYAVYDYGYLKCCERIGLSPEDPDTEPQVRYLHNGLVTADQLTVEQHLQMAAAAQEWVDSAVSKTINCPTSMSIEEFRQVYTRAYELGLKGCTTYRPDPRSGRGAVLEVPATGKEVEHEVAPTHPETIDDKTSVHMAPPSIAIAGKIPMQDVVEGRRYRIKWPTEDCSYYIMITDHTGVDGVRRPFELFVSTKSERHSEWVKAFSLLVTAIFRREGDPSFVVDELKSVFSASGGTWTRVPWRDRPVLATSLVAAIGLKVEEHMRWLGLIKPDDAFVAPGHTDLMISPEAIDAATELMPAQELMDVCDQCGARAVIYAEGCATCHACGKSDCG